MVFCKILTVNKRAAGIVRRRRRLHWETVIMFVAGHACMFRLFKH